MAQPVWQDQGFDQFRDVARRLASVIQCSDDRKTALSQFTDGTRSGEAFTELLIEWSSRWFNESGGQQILVGPELFWLLSEPEPRKGIRSQIPGGDVREIEPTPGQRGRKLLLVCVLETLAQTQWQQPETLEEKIPVLNGVGLNGLG
ncbi:hypothetical protein AB0H76_25780 [Nocardia sp. NPDC050712]|uniref:hypothetical protein n=1 Tax=Nocardia sp. NPDC050712 TaxID=3155518 RepID=UPI0033FFD953